MQRILLIMILGLVFDLSVASAQEVPMAFGKVVTDAELLTFANENKQDFRFYQDNDQWLAYTPRGGGHAGWIRVRFNQIAASSLDGSGKLPIGAKFPPGSIVVKEIKDRLSDQAVALAIMVKDPQAMNANQSWVWGEYEANGDPIVSALEGGRSCIRCHSVTERTSPVKGDLGHRDFVRTFGLRP